MYGGVANLQLLYERVWRLFSDDPPCYRIHFVIMLDKVDIAHQQLNTRFCSCSPNAYSCTTGRGNSSDVLSHCGGSASSSCGNALRPESMMVMKSPGIDCSAALERRVRSLRSLRYAERKQYMRHLLSDAVQQQENNWANTRSTLLLQSWKVDRCIALTMTIGERSLNATGRCLTK